MCRAICVFRGSVAGCAWMRLLVRCITRTGCRCFKSKVALARILCGFSQRTGCARLRVFSGEKDAVARPCMLLKLELFDAGADYLAGLVTTDAHGMEQARGAIRFPRSEEHTSELQSRG